MRKFGVLLVLLTACSSGADKADVAAPIGASSPFSFTAEFHPSAPARCDVIYQQALAVGLGLSQSWRFICPGGGLDEANRPHWGVACFGGFGPEGQCPYISVNLDRIGSNVSKQRYVILHELCHAQGNVSERATDRCAANAGADLRWSPYE
ncbi:MAG: hypothetical protein ACRD8W_00470 [Nitrososphaeraceae archaeon]